VWLLVIICWIAAGFAGENNEQVILTTFYFISLDVVVVI
jgi:hypothetical protein